jgi:phage terminase large subunit-like protein
MSVAGFMNATLQTQDISNLSNIFIPSLFEGFKTQDELSLDIIKSIPSFLTDNVTGNLVKLADIHREWHRHIDQNKMSLIIAPRDHGKSEQIAIGRVLCEIGKNPYARVKLFSGSQSEANKRVQAIKKYISNSENYQTAYPHIKPDKNGLWTQSAIKIQSDRISKEPTLEAYGSKSTVTGDRADLIICDDIVTEDAISSAAYREDIKEKFYNDIINLLEPNGKLIYICTLWHHDDLSCELMRNRDSNGFALLFQAIPENMEPIWGEKWTKEALEERRAIQPRAFDRGFRNIPISDEEALFPRDLVGQCIKVGNVPRDNKWKIYIGVDLAISKEDTADYTIIFVLAIDENGKKIPLEIIRRRMGSPETAKMLIEMDKKYNPNMIFVENNAYQDSLIQWIKETSEKPLPIQGFMTGKQKYDEFIGLPSLAAESLSESACTCGFCTFVDELTTFPVGKHDDTIMAAWFAREAAREDARGGVDYW